MYFLIRSSLIYLIITQNFTRAVYGFLSSKKIVVVPKNGANLFLQSKVILAPPPRYREQSGCSSIDFFLTCLTTFLSHVL